MERPDLSTVSPLVRAYIEYLENKIQSLEKPRVIKAAAQPADIIPDTVLAAELPTTINIVSVSREGSVKRTPRHLYSRQHRGGMGVFDLDVNAPDQPCFITAADQASTLLLFSSKARVFRYPLSKIEEKAVHARGDLFERLPLDPGEMIVAALPDRASGYVALASKAGHIRSLRHHLFGEHMRPGTAMYNYADFGPLASVVWTKGDGDLVLISKKGMGIRFSEKLVPPQGGKGINLSSGDELVAVAPVNDDNGLLLLTADGKGAIREMSGFAPNKSLGGSGKIAIKTDHCIGALTADLHEDVFMISRIGKIIRFPMDEVPTTEGVVQGVNCMMLRMDEVVFATKGNPAE